MGKPIKLQFKQIEFYKERSVLRKRKRKFFIRLIEEGKLKCPDCSIKMRVLKKRNGLVNRSGYCPKCGKVINFTYHESTVDKVFKKNPNNYEPIHEQLKLWKKE